jgi:hypothetical protein
MKTTLCSPLKPQSARQHSVPHVSEVGGSIEGIGVTGILKDKSANEQFALFLWTRHFPIEKNGASAMVIGRFYQFLKVRYQNLVYPQQPMFKYG